MLNDVMEIQKYSKIRQSALITGIMRQKSAGSKFIVFRKRELQITLDNTA